MSLLERIDCPADLRRLPADALPALAAEIRSFLLATLSRSGGHVAASLGTVELTLALHRALDLPHDRLVWDIGHQAHVHKLLTGRGTRLHTQRALGGLAPFLSRAESRYDAFGAGHAGTSLSAAAGFALAARQPGAVQRRIAAVIGDGGLTAGMAFEALNHIGGEQLGVLVVLNDNDMSISENVGALRERAALALGRPARGWNCNPGESSAADPGADAAGSAGSLGAWFEALGLRYFGPIDGHNLAALEAALEARKHERGPCVLHVVTTKGRGYAPAEADPIGFHGTGRFTLGAALAPASGPRSWSQVFGDWLCAAAAADPRIVAITPAMREGSGLVEFGRHFPQRLFDVGIAEQHAVTLAAGLAAEGMRPVVAIYSTFLQRGLDQLIHDVALQRLPVVFAIDRAGLVGADGATHHGAFDLNLLRMVPGLLLMAPADAADAVAMLDCALQHDGPSAVRYPRGAAAAPLAGTPNVALATGRARRLRRGRAGGAALLCFGALLEETWAAALLLDASAADMRFVKPLDADCVAELAATHQVLVTIEDNCRNGGAGAAVAERVAAGPPGAQVLRLGLPDAFVEHGTREQLLAACGLDAAGIVAAVAAFLGNFRQ